MSVLNKVKPHVQSRPAVVKTEVLHLFECLLLVQYSAGGGLPAAIKMGVFLLNGRGLKFFTRASRALLSQTHHSKIPRSVPAKVLYVLYVLSHGLAQCHTYRKIQLYNWWRQAFCGHKMIQLLHNFSSTPGMPSTLRTLINDTIVNDQTMIHCYNETKSYKINQLLEGGVWERRLSLLLGVGLSLQRMRISEP